VWTERSQVSAGRLTRVMAAIRRHMPLPFAYNAWIPEDKLKL
jgi:hypothetical protein